MTKHITVLEKLWKYMPDLVKKCKSNYRCETCGRGTTFTTRNCVTCNGRHL